MGIFVGSFYDNEKVFQRAHTQNLSILFINHPNPVPTGYDGLHVYRGIPFNYLWIEANSGEKIVEYACRIFEDLEEYEMPILTEMWTVHDRRS